MPTQTIIPSCKQCGKPNYTGNKYCSPKCGREANRRWYKANAEYRSEQEKKKLKLILEAEKAKIRKKLF